MDAYVGDDPNMITKIQDPSYLNQVAETYKGVLNIVNKFKPQLGLGFLNLAELFTTVLKICPQPLLMDFGNIFLSFSSTSTFSLCIIKHAVDLFSLNRYLDQLGMASTYNHKVFCRQTIIGGNYAFLNTATSIPNPDYNVPLMGSTELAVTQESNPNLHVYAHCAKEKVIRRHVGAARDSMEATQLALLWHRLMGSTVPAVTQESNPNLHVYAHCAKKKPRISIIFIHLSKDSSFNVTLSNYKHQSHNLRSTDVAKPNFEFRGSKDREEYHLAVLAGNIQGQIVLLNDTPMVPTETFNLPVMEPKVVNASMPISIVAHSMVYVTIRDFQASACA
ncbi:heparanase-like protein 1 [Gossypium hirsutum]|uniref:Heparanase-like protein 1 n=1 Tax=Gossypium hirsutum TaxID=3635 RepID=A0A1U8I2K2_GOSHI|nr:heparanase-like protein 1 [Gossypium hirsutum]